MAGHQFEYKIGFTVETSALQEGLKDAVKQLQEISKNPANHLTADLKEAAAAARELERHLANAFNTETGKLDLAKFQQELTASGHNLEYYRDMLYRTGQTGSAAFLNVARSISSAELPIRRSNAALEKLWTTMKNTLRWKLTNAALQGFVGAVQTAYGYTKDLNESLNSIRIVTGQSVEEMKQFAETANQAAEALSTTTQRYAEASLIYYRQGLDADEVENRTNVTIKLANVAGETAEKASEQMTAVWNNFYDGSKSLEYYADVMAKLGAVTASSTQEISQGLQKFAAIADTVGLSYEYAAAALATVTATTRESADVVGTAFRTLFGRLESLKLGETLEDGIDLNKYSLALKTVGVDINDVNGNLKDMDVILDETMEKWATLNRNQQMALAQSVAGVRQYAQFIALMDNADFFKQNLSTARGAEGTLGEQAEIFEESWEAASNRVRAAAEDIYDSIFDDERFVKLADASVSVLHRIENIVDSLGGLRGILLTVFNLTNQIYGDKLANGMNTWLYNLKQQFGLYENIALSLQKNAIEVGTAFNSNQDSTDRQEHASIIEKQNEAYQKANEIATELRKLYKSMSEEDAKRAEGIVAQIDEARDSIQAYKEAAVKAIEEIDDARKKMMETEGTYNRNQMRGLMQGVVQKSDGTRGTEKYSRGELSQDQKAYVNQILGRDANNTKVVDLGTAENLQKLKTEYLNVSSAAGKYKAQIASLNKIEQTNSELSAEQHEELQRLTDEYKQLEENIKTLQKVLEEGWGISAKAVEAADETVQENEQVIEESSQNTQAALDNIKTGTDELVTAYQKVTGQAQTFGDKMVQISQSLSAAFMALQAIKNIGRVFSDEDMSTMDRFTTLLMSMSMLLPAINSLTKSHIALLVTQNLTLEIANVLEKKQVGLKSSNALASLALRIAEKHLARQQYETIGTTEAMNSALAGTAAVAGGVILAISAVALAISALIQWQKKQKQAQEEANQAFIEKTQENQELIDSNKELIKSFNEALAAYDQSDESKSKLDEASRALADAYDIEGAALAKLSGRYEDYNDVLEQAQAKRRQELQAQLLDQETSLAEQYESIRDVLKVSGSGDTGLYSGTTGKEELVAYDIFRKHVSDEFVAESARGTSASSGAWIRTKFDLDDQAKAIQYYNELNAAYKEMITTMTSTEQKDSGFFSDIQKQIKELEPLIEEYNKIKRVVISLKSELGEFGNESDLSTLPEYYKWLENITNVLSSSGYEQPFIDEVIENLIASSTNTNLKDLKDLADTIKRIKTLVGENSGLDIDKIFSNDQYDKDTLALVSWRTITLETWEKAYESAEKYRKALADVENGTKQLESAQQALKDLGDGTFSIESLTALKEDIDWESLGEDFTGFLNATYTEQQQFLNQLISDGYNQIVEGNKENIERQREEIARLELEHDKYKKNPEELQQAQSLYDAYNDLIELQRQYQAASGDDKNNIESQIQAVYERLNELGGTVSFDIELSEEQFVEQVNDASKGVKLILDKENQFQIDKKACEDSLQQSLDAIPIYKKVQLDFQLDRIRNSTDGYVEIFEALAKGVQQTTDEMGNSFWSFSIEAAKAIDNIYPGFMANAKVMKDGTLQINDEMYQSFFDMMSNEVSADGNGIAAMLQNRITFLESKRDEAKEALEIAEQLANGEVVLDTLKTDQKETLLSQYRDAQAIAEGDMLKNEADYLEESRGNYETLWNDVSDYSANAADDMADNIAIGTESVLENLKTIRDQAYDAMRAVASIGKEGATEAPKFNRKVNWGNKDFVNSVNANGSADDFVRSLADYQYSDLPDTEDGNEKFLAISKAAGEQLKRIYQQQINTYNAAIGAAKEAQAKLFKSIDDAYKKAGGSGKSGSSREQQLKDLEEIFERYHEITREIAYQERLLKKLSTEIERAYGSKRLELFGKKIQELNKLAELQAKKYEAAAAFIAIDLQSLEDLGLSGNQNDHFELENYTELLQQSLDEYNAAIDAYNASINLEGADKDSLEQTLKEAKDLYDHRVEALKHYEDSVDTYRDLVEAWEETQRTIEDEKLNEITYKIQVILDIKKLKQDLNNFIKEIAESFGDALTHTLDSDNLTGVFSMVNANAQEEINSLIHYQEEYDALIQRLSEATDKTSIDAIKEELATLTQNIIESGEALLEWLDYWENMVPEAISAARERFDEFLNSLSHSSTILSTIKELYALQGQTYKTLEGFERLQNLAYEQMNASIAQAKLNKTWYERAYAMYQEAEQQLQDYLANGGTEQGVQYDQLKKTRDALLEEFQKAQEAYLTNSKDALEAAKNIYVDEIQRASYEFGQAMVDSIKEEAANLDILQEKFDHFIKTEERYFDEVNTKYHVQTWYNKIQQDIDKTTNKLYRDRLEAFKEEEVAARARNGLNQYDLDILEAKYKLLQAEMALEDAKNNKTTLRLARDSQGNWSYQYSANQDDIADAQQKVLDAQNEWYNIAKNQNKNIAQEILALMKESQEAIAALDQLGIEDAEEYNQRRAEIEKYYSEQIDILYQELGVARQDMTEAGVASLGEFENAYADTLDSMTINADDFKEALRTALEKCDEYYQKFADTVSEVASDLEVTVDKLDTTVSSTAEDIEKLKDKGEECADALWDKIEEVKAAADAYSGFAESVYKAIQALKELAGKAVDTVIDTSGFGNQDLSVAYTEAVRRGASQDELDAILLARQAKLDSMPGNNYISNEELIATVAELIARGDKETLDALTSGNMYFNDDLKQYMEEWKAANQENTQVFKEGADELKSTGDKMEEDYPKFKEDQEEIQEKDKENTDKQADQIEEAEQEIVEPIKNTTDTMENKVAPSIADSATNIDEAAQLIRDAADSISRAAGNLDAAASNLRAASSVSTGQSVPMMDTGGYTGEWGSSAKLAALHEKELVLNASDTSNILAAVQAVRAIEHSLDGNALAVQGLLAMRLGTPGIASPQAQQLDQYVHIDEVSFPNVTSADGIEEAFRNLVNDAAQYALARNN